MKLVFPKYTIIFGAAAFALRFVQCRRGFEPDTALPIPGDLSATALPLVLAAALAALIFWSAGHLPALGRWQADLSAPSPAGRRLVWVGCVLLLIGGAWELAQGAEIQSVLTAQGLQRAVPLGRAVIGGSPLAAAACLSIPMLPLGLRPETKSLALLPTPVLLLARAVFIYRANSADPVLAHYYPQLLAEMTLILGSYRLCGSTVGRGRPRHLGIYASMAPILTLTVVCLGGTMALLGYCLSSRLTLLSDPEETPPQP